MKYTTRAHELYIRRKKNRWIVKCITIIVVILVIVVLVVVVVVIIQWSQIPPHVTETNKIADGVCACLFA